MLDRRESKEHDDGAKCREKAEKPAQECPPAAANPCLTTVLEHRRSEEPELADCGAVNPETRRGASRETRQPPPAGRRRAAT